MLFNQSTSNLSLDKHQANILLELGVPKFLLQRLINQTAVSSSAAGATAPANSTAPAAELAVTPLTTAAMAPASLSSNNSAINTELVTMQQLQQGCALRPEQQLLAYASGDTQAAWLFISEIPYSKRSSQPSTSCQQLLDNMLQALNLSKQQGAFSIELYPSHCGEQWQTVTNQWIKQLIKLLPSKIIVVLGRKACQTVLGTQMSADKLRGKTHSFAQLPLIASYSPELLLVRPVDKKQAWQDLCRAYELLQNQNN